MQSSLVGRVVLGIAVVAAAVVLLIVLRDSDDGNGAGGGATTATTEQTGSKSNGKPTRPSEPSIPTIVVEGGQPVGGVEELSFEAGERIRFAVRSDASDEVHVHGYDVEKEVGPGELTRFDFPASIEGVFEAELHGSGEQIAELRVEP
ncbi:MAG TPA: hypothetical protein VF729_08760 [Solirubrobacterales bacterium]